MAIATLETLSKIGDLTGLSESEMIVALAVHLYSLGKLAKGEVQRLTGLNDWEFYRVLGQHEIPVNYGVEEFEEDMKTARRLGLS